MTPNEPTTECAHDLAERETACADGFCPLCMQHRLCELERDRERLDFIIRVLMVLMPGNRPITRQTIDEAMSQN